MCACVRVRVLVRSGVVLSARGGKECPIKHSEQNTWRVESYREEIHRKESHIQERFI